MYPSIVTDNIRDDLHQQAQEGSVVDWQAFRMIETGAAAQHRHADSGAQGSDWAFSGNDHSGGSHHVSGGGHSTVGAGGSW